MPKIPPYTLQFKREAVKLLRAGDRHLATARGTSRCTGAGTDCGRFASRAYPGLFRLWLGGPIDDLAVGHGVVAGAEPSSVWKAACGVPRRLWRKTYSSR